MSGSKSNTDKREIDVLIEFIRANPFPEELEEAKVAIDALGTPIADDVAVELMGAAKPMKDTLIRLDADNLANLVPHPLFSWFNYSHPPPVERIERLENMMER